MLTLFGILVTLPLLASFYATRRDYGRHVDAFMAASMLCVFWAFTNTIAALYEFPESKKFHSLVDLIGLTACVLMYVSHRDRWKAVLASLFMAQLVAHAVFWGACSGVTAGGIGRNYVLYLNVTWLAQLVCVAYPGGRVVSRDLVHWLRRHRGVGAMGGAE